MDEIIPSGHRRTRWLVSAAACALLAAALTVPDSAAHSEAGARPAGAALRSAAHSGFADGKWGDATADSLSKDAYGQYAPDKDPGSLFNVERAIGARALWGKRDASQRNVTGQGIAVAVLDSGTSSVPGLSTGGKLTFGPDLSIEENGVLTQQDTYGHGTFMAGIIGGRSVTNPSSDLPGAPANIQLGVAPDAKLLAMKLATTDGSTDVSEVIAALDWVVQHPVMPDGTRIRVINLSYGTDSLQSYQLDPLAAAAENAWNHGIVVVTSAGNAGALAGTLTDPAVDPYLISVGATDSNDRLDGWRFDHATVASFSNVGSTMRHVDLVAPGTSIVSLRNPNSFIDTNFPTGRVSGDGTGRLFRGSGTSQAAAVVSGSVALLLQAFPSLTPDQVKYALTASADKLTTATVLQQGAGTIDLDGAYAIAQRLASGTDATATSLRSNSVQQFPTANGQGSVDLARGSSALVDTSGNPVTGEIDAQGYSWDPATWWQATSTGRSWDGGNWMGHTWAGGGWDTSSGLSNARWTNARWTSARWTTADWSNARWTAASWSNARWTCARWTSARWTAAGWL